MTGENVCEAERVPHLPEAGIDIEKGAARRGGEDFPVVEETHDVEQQHGLARFFQHAGARQAERFAAAIQRPRDIAEHVREPARVCGIRGVEAVEEKDIESEPAKAEQVLQENPRVSAAAGPLRDRACDDDRAVLHAASTSGVSATVS